jgi:hypothetical protein
VPKIEIPGKIFAPQRGLLNFLAKSMAAVSSLPLIFEGEP